MKTIGIVGSRKRNLESDYRKIREAFYSVFKEGDRICSGGCPKGGDRFADAIARSTGIPILIFYPGWDTHATFASFRRNTFIAKESDILIACVIKDRTGGTEDTIKKWGWYHPDLEPMLV